MLPIDVNRKLFTSSMFGAAWGGAPCIANQCYGVHLSAIWTGVITGLIVAGGAATHANSNP